MIYLIIADIIAFLHAVLAAIIFYPLLCLLCGKQVPMWLAVSCFTGAMSSIISYILIRDCFINPLQKYFQRLAGTKVFRGSFTAHYPYKATGIEISRHLPFWATIVAGVASGIFIVRQIF